MTLSLIKSPAAVSLVGNDILFKINTDNRYSSVGSNSLLTLLFSDIDTTPGNKFKLEWGNFEKEFTLVATPDGSGLQLPAATSGQDLAEWVEMLADALKSNYDLSEEFLVEYVSGPAPDESIYISSIEKGSDKSLTFTNDPINPVQNISEDANTAGTDPIGRDFYQLLCRVWLAGSSGDTLLGEDRLTPDADGNCSFKVQEYLKPEVGLELNYPENNGNPVFKTSGFIKEYFIEYAETYDGDVFRLYDHEDVFVIPGKINIEKEIILNELEMSFFDEIQTRQMFLSWHPLEKTIGKWQPEKLYFLNYLKTNYLNVYADIRFADNDYDTILIKQISSGAYDVIEICCGHDLLGFQYLSKPVDYYEIYVKDTRGDVISEKRKFIIDQQYQPYERAFIFLNSLGVYETLRTTGLESKTNAFEHDLIDKITIDGDLNYSKNNNQNTWMDETFDANTGWITKDQVDWINDFILSKERYILEDFQKVEILVTSTKVFQHKDDEILYYVEFEYKKSIVSDAYSKPNSLMVLLTETAIPILTEEDELIIL